MDRGSVNRVILAAISLVAIIAACSVAASSPASPGQAARERVVAAYLAALEERDRAAIAAMVSPGIDATSEIAAELDRYGGVRLHDARVSYLDEFAGVYVVATVSGTGDEGADYTITVPMSRVDGRYYVALGQVAPSGSEADPASPRPSSGE
jgi:hypothetical protein